MSSMTQNKPKDNQPNEPQAYSSEAQRHRAQSAKLLSPILHDSHFGGEVEVIEAVPEESTIAQTAPVYYAHGAGWAQEEPTIVEMARQGRRAFSMEFGGARKSDARFVIGHSDLGDSESLQHIAAKEITSIGELGMVVSQQQMRAAATLLGVIAERGATDITAAQVDAVLQSESAGHGLIAAYAAPDKFRNIVLAFPGSLSGKRTGFIPARLVRDVFARRKHRPSPENDFRQPDRPGYTTNLRMQLKAPGFRENAAGLRYSDLTRMLHSLRGRKGAPGVTLVAGLNDGIFKLEDYLKHLVASTDIDRLIVVPGGHAISGRKDVLATILAQFPAMEAAKTTAQEGIAMVLKPLRDRIVLPAGISRRRVERIYKLADAVDRRTPGMDK
jgi:hypothetical protein